MTVGLLQGDLAVIENGIEPGTRLVVSDLIPAIAGMLLAPRPDKAVLARLRADAVGGTTPQ